MSWYNFSEPPNNNYKKFFDKIKEVDTTDILLWNKYHLLGYFCKRYYYKYNSVYNFKFNTSSPSKSTDFHMINVISSKISKDPSIFKQYIDFIFDEKLSQSKNKIRSITVLNKEDYLYEFKNRYLFVDNAKINRSDNLPEKYLQLLKDYQINTYGDLAFLYQLLDKNEKSKIVFKILTDNGFDINLLSKVI